MNSIISWVGGKKALRDLIYLRMPKHYDRYIEVFGGGGWVLFGKPSDKCMEVYNDFNSNLANLFYCVVCPAKLDHTSRCKSGHSNRQ